MDCLAAVLPYTAKGLNHGINRKILIPLNISLPVGLVMSEFQNNFRNDPTI
jgi:hypothetical protein